MSVQVIGPIDTGTYNYPGLMVRAFGPNGSPLQPTNNSVSENSLLWGVFDEFSYANMLKNNVNGAKADTGPGTIPNSNYWLRMVKTGATINVFEKSSQAAAWTNVSSVTRADFNTGAPLQVGIEHSDFAGGATHQAQYANFSLTATTMGPLAATPSPATGLTLTGNASGNIVASWTQGAGSSGSLVAVWTGPNTAVKEAPANGFAYAGNAGYGLGASLPGLNYYVVYPVQGTNVTITNVAAGTPYNVAVFSYAQAGGAGSTAYNHTPATGRITAPGLAAGSVVAQATVQGTNILVTFNSNPPKWYIVQYAASLMPVNWENLFAIPVQATNSFMAYLHSGGAMAAEGFYRIEQFDSPPPGVNLAPVATDSTSYVSPWQTLSAINDGYDPANSGDTSHGAYGNWVGNGPNGTQWVEYDFTQPITTAKTDVYWWQDGEGVYAPSACRLKYWDGANWDLVVNPVGLGVLLNQYNTTTFNAVTTTGLRLEMDSDGTNSTGLLQWKVYDTGATPNFPPRVTGDVDRDVVIGGVTYFSGGVFDDGKLYPPQPTWSKASGPGTVTFSNATALSTSATLSAAGAAVLQLTAFDGQYYGSNTVNVSVAPPFPATHPLPLYVDKNSYTISNTLWNYRLKNNIIHWIPHLYAQLNNTNLAQGNIYSFMQAEQQAAGPAYTVPAVDP